MTWVNLNDVYVPKTGGTITGALTVNGNLTINDGTGNGTTYNVANEITSLRDSVSPTTNTGIQLASSFTSSREYTNKSVRIGNIVYLAIASQCGSFSAWESWHIGTAPKPFNGEAFGTALLQCNSNMIPVLVQITNTGDIYIINKSSTGISCVWMFAMATYLCQ